LLKLAVVAQGLHGETVTLLPLISMPWKLGNNQVRRGSKGEKGVSYCIGFSDSQIKKVHVMSLA
jgi:hypothetical protein